MSPEMGMRGTGGPEGVIQERDGIAQPAPALARSTEGARAGTRETPQATLAEAIHRRVVRPRGHVARDPARSPLEKRPLAGTNAASALYAAHGHAVLAEHALIQGVVCIRSRGVGPEASLLAVCVLAPASQPALPDALAGWVAHARLPQRGARASFCAGHAAPVACTDILRTLRGRRSAAGARRVLARVDDAAAGAGDGRRERDESKERGD
jgi:hypothetical protein